MCIYAIGIDPDLHNTAVAVVSPDCVIDLLVVSIPDKYKGQEAVARMVSAIGSHLPSWLHKIPIRHWPAVTVAEGQEIYAGGKTPNWDSVLQLGPVTGAAAGIIAARGMTKMIVPKPKKWNGGLAKCVTQGRVLTKYGIEYEIRGSLKPRTSMTPRRDTRYCVPLPEQAALPLGMSFLKTQWKHAVDAIALASWGLKQIGSTPGGGM